MTVITALKPSRIAIAGSADAGPRPRAITFCAPVTRYRSGLGDGNYDFVHMISG